MYLPFASSTRWRSKLSWQASDWACRPLLRLDEPASSFVVGRRRRQPQHRTAIARSPFPHRNVRFVLSPPKALVTLHWLAKSLHSRPMLRDWSARFLIPLATRHLFLGSAARRAIRALPQLSPSDASNALRIPRSGFLFMRFRRTHMRSLFKLVVFAALLAGTPGCFRSRKRNFDDRGRATLGTCDAGRRLNRRGIHDTRE